MQALAGLRDGEFAKVGAVLAGAPLVSTNKSLASARQAMQRDLSMEQAFPGNLPLFYLLNAGPSANPLTVHLALFLASQLILLLIAGLVLLWFAGTPLARAALMRAGVGLGLAMVLNLVIATAIFMPRPYMLGIGQALMAHGPDSSFPSDHGSFFWSLGLGLMLGRPLRLLGVGITLAGFAVAWARIYVGVHFPLDFAGSMAIALVSVAVARRFSGWCEPRVFVPVERLHQSLLARVRR